MSYKVCFSIFPLIWETLEATCHSNDWFCCRIVTQFMLSLNWKYAAVLDQFNVTRMRYVTTYLFQEHKTAITLS
jgi:hypothetical protein